MKYGDYGKHIVRTREHGKVSACGFDLIGPYSVPLRIPSELIFLFRGNLVGSLWGAFGSFRGHDAMQRVGESPSGIFCDAWTRAWAALRSVTGYLLADHVLDRSHADTRFRGGAADPAGTAHAAGGFASGTQGANHGPGRRCCT